MHSLDLYLATHLFAFASTNIWTEYLAVFFSDGLLLLAVCSYVLVILPLRRRGKYLRTLYHDFAPAITTALLAYAIKFVFPMARPYHALGFQPLVPATDPMASFPSWHVAVVAALATTLVSYHRRLAYFIAGLVPFVMLGRMLIGVHWFSDTLAGLFLGVAVGLLWDWGYGKVQVRNQKK